MIHQYIFFKSKIYLNNYKRSIVVNRVKSDIPNLRLIQDELAKTYLETLMM